ncbi:hypothetical protein [Lactococcus cremoris]|uniref:hypothetical protein n=1 Tax=Lactococcus lactis subsp. cremoris TaxID=1359 RepID=UPI001E4F44B2|nr:hypothetical protein [Lactococcus cremoris]
MKLPILADTTEVKLEAPPISNVVQERAESGVLEEKNLYYYIFISQVELIFKNCKNSRRTLNKQWIFDK